MTTKLFHIVGKVLPLIVDRGRRACAEVEIVAALYTVTIEWQTSAAATCTSQAITETRGNGEAF